MQMEAQRRLVEYLAKALVDDPDAVVVEESASGQRVLDLRVAPDDRGKVIGKKGRTAHAIRALLAATSEHDPIGLEIVD